MTTPAAAAGLFHVQPVTSVGDQGAVYEAAAFEKVGVGGAKGGGVDLGEKAEGSTGK